jgi:autotransporter-associated beta strand protein
MSQSTEIWTGGGDGTNLATAANWGGTLPSTANGDTGEWNGTVPGNLVLHYNNPNANFQSGPGQNGVNFYLAAGQTGSVKIVDDASSSPYLAIENVTLDPGVGSFILGDTNTANLLWCIGRPNGAIHNYINNSTSPAIINPQVRWAGGGGANWTFDFQGTGNWYCTNYLNNDNGPGMSIQLDGPGNMYWNPQGYLGANGINSPITINNGTLYLLGYHPKLGGQAFSLNGNFVFNAPSQSETLSGVFSGTGSVTNLGGSLTLSGQSTFSGDMVLAGGEVFVTGTENAGTSGPLGIGQIDFTGGTLGYSLNNTFDYSSRFNTGANQAYSIDTAGQNVTYATGLTSSGGTLNKLGSGTLTLAGVNSYSGLTTVTLGKLVIQGSKSGSANITVADGASLGVVENGTQITPGTLTMGSASGATLEFNNLTNTTTAPILAGTVSAASPITININSGVFKTIGQQFPLLSWTSGSAPAVTLGTVSGAAGTLSTVGNTIILTITSTPYVWTGVTSGSWDTTTSGNWSQSGNPVVFASGALALFDDTATGQTNVTIAGVVQPASVTFSDNTLIYGVTSSPGNDIGGTGPLSKSGAATVTLSGGANTYSGATTVSGGTLSVSTLSNGGTASDIGAASSSAANLVLNGGSLQYTGAGASIDHSFTLGAAGGTLDSSGTGALSLTNTIGVALSGSGPHTLILAGNNTNQNTLALNITNAGGATAVTKDGTGTWVLVGTNSFSGLTTINNGLLQIGAGTGSGTIGSGNILDNGTVGFDSAANLTVSGLISGSGRLIDSGTGTLILTGNNTYSGGTTVTAGTLQLGNGGTSGKLAGNSSITLTNNSTFNFDSKTLLTLSGFGVGVLGQGNLIVSSGCTLAVIDNATYTGWTSIASGATFQPCYGNEGNFYSSVVTNSGTLLFIRQDNAVFGYSNNIVGSGKVVKDNNNANSGDVTLAGTNSYTGGTWIGGGGIIIGDGINSLAGSIVGPVIFTNTSSAFLNSRYLTFNQPTDFVFTNPIIGAVTDASSTGNSGTVIQNGPGNLILTGNNSYVGGTTIAAGMLLQAGNGGTSGSVGTGAISDGGTLVVNRSDSLTIPGTISDNSGSSGSLIQNGTGTLTLTGLANFTGPTTVSNGVLVVANTGTNSLTGDLDMYGGTLVAGSISSVKTLTIGGNLNIYAGTIVATLNESLAQSNTVISVSNAVTVTIGTINASGGSLKVLNAGPLPHVGDKFYIFNQPVSGGNTMSIVSPGLTVQNNLSVDGSISITGVSPAPTLSASRSVSGTTLNLTWPANWTGGVHVQSMTNSLAVGLKGTNWVTIAGTDASNSYGAAINTNNATVFYRLVAP